MTQTVLMDANALMIPFQFHVNVEAEVERVITGGYEIKVPSSVIEELEDLTEELGGQDQWAAKMALKLAGNFTEIDTDERGDPGILELAEAEDAVVVTNDRLLRARLRAKDVPVLFLRSKAYLALEGFIE